MYPSATLRKGLVSLALTTMITLATCAPLGPLGEDLNLRELGPIKAGAGPRDNTGRPNTLEKSSPVSLDLVPPAILTIGGLDVEVGNLARRSSDPTALE